MQEVNPINLESLTSVAKNYVNKSKERLNFADSVKRVQNWHESVENSIKDWLESRNYNDEKRLKEEYTKYFNNAVGDYFETNKESNPYFNTVLKDFNRFKNEYCGIVDFHIQLNSGFFNNMELEKSFIYFDPVQKLKG